MSPLIVMDAFPEHVTSIEIVRQPVGVMNDAEQPVPDIMLPFEQQPAVRMNTSAGTPANNFRVNAMFVAENTTTFSKTQFWQSVLLKKHRATAMPDITPFDLETVTPHTRISRRADVNGVAEFENLMFMDALPGCYRVVFFVAGDYFVPENIPRVALSEPSDIICVNVSMKMNLVSSVTERVSLGEPIPSPRLLHESSIERNASIPRSYFASLVALSYSRLTISTLDAGLALPEQLLTTSHRFWDQSEMEEIGTRSSLESSSVLAIDFSDLSWANGFDADELTLGATGSDTFTF